MSPLLDLILTIAGFVVLLPGIALLMVMGLFGGVMTNHNDAPGMRYYLVGAALLVPPLVVIVVYVGGIVCAWRAAGSTFYYPWVTLGVVVAGWFAVSWPIFTWLENASPNPRPRDSIRRYAVSGTVHTMTAAEIASELDGVVLDNRVYLRDSSVLTPTATPRRKRALPREYFRSEHRVFVVRADHGLPDGWTLERSEIPGDGGMPGGGIQYLFRSPDWGAGFQPFIEREAGLQPVVHREAGLQPLIDRGFLEEIHRR